MDVKRLIHKKIEGGGAAFVDSGPFHSTSQATLTIQESVMRFISLIRVQENTGQVPSEQLMHDMGKLIDEMTRSGHLVSTAGLRPSSEGVRVRLQRGKLSTVDGPFTVTKEVIGGYAILQAKSKAEAIELTKRFLKIHGDDWDITCEVRQLDGPEFGSAA